MKSRAPLVTTSLLAILFFTLHFTEDIVRGIEEGNVFDYTGVLLVTLWLYATLALTHRRLGLGIVLFFSIAAAAIPLIHMRGEGLVGGNIAGSNGVFLWVFALLALGITGLVAAALAVRALWALRRGRSPAPTGEVL